ncbi:EAL domain-containing protein [Bacillota bacterium LX-D]|nr:EAL domain-containing protein [Bacillota bacterium LX-D]
MPEYYNEKIIFAKIKEKLASDPMLFGMGVWFEPYAYDKSRKYYGPYIYRDNNNQNVFTWRYSTSSYDYLNEDWYKVGFGPQKKDIYFNNVFYDKILNTYFITGTAPIYKNNKFMGGATADISIREIDDYVREIKVGREGYAFVLTNNGYILGNPPFIQAENKQKGTMANYDINKVTNIKDEKNNEYKNLEKLVFAEGSGLLELKQNKEIASYAAIGDSGLSLVLIFPENELYSSFISTLRFYFLLFFLLLLIFPFLLSLVIKDTIDKPLNKLLKKVHKIMQGDFSQDNLLDSVISSKNEFGILGKSIIKMAHNLAELVKDLNKQNTELLESRKKLKNLAYFDALTNLPNRLYFYDEISALIKRNEKFALFFMDLDNFKIINDSYGHSTGDEVLNCIGQRLLTLAGDKISAARFGGDEFVLTVKNISGKDGISSIAKEIHQAVNRPIFLNDNIYYICISIGIAIYPDDATSVNELLKNADTAMFKGKENGKGRSEFYDRKMNESIIEKSLQEKNLRKALVNDEFKLYYQPIYDLNANKIIGFEALLRWIMPDQQVVTPSKFIKVLEDTGLIIPVGVRVIKNACFFVRRLLNLGYTDLRMSLNASVIQIMDNNFSKVVLDAIKEARIPPESIEIEITESRFMESYELCMQNISQLLKEGVRFAIDDFGTGYSSLYYLKQLPVTTIKIDKFFIDNLNPNSNKNLTELIIVLALKLDLEVVAEGVETWEQYDVLKKYGCDLIQGYIISRPLPEEQAIKLLEVRK